MSTPLLSDFPELSHLSREDLEDLLNEPAYFQAVFHSLPRVEAMLESQVELGLANESIAKNNLAMQEDLYRIRAETQKSFDDAKALEARWTEVEREEREVYQRFAPSFLLLRLKHATTAQDDASELLASSFVQASSVDGPVEPIGKEVDDFVKEFKELRKVYHKRVMWINRWSVGKVIWRDD